MKAERRFVNAFAFCFLFLLIIACKGGNEEQLPVDFVWDREACEECKMALSDPHYSAQVIDLNGEAYYFDDIGCAILWLRRQPWKDKARTWVNDAKPPNGLKRKKPAGNPEILRPRWVMVLPPRFLRLKTRWIMKR